MNTNQNRLLIRHKEQWQWFRKKEYDKNKDRIKQLTGVDRDVTSIEPFAYDAYLNRAPPWTSNQLEGAGEP